MQSGCHGNKWCAYVTWEMNMSLCVSLSEYVCAVCMQSNGICGKKKVCCWWLIMDGVVHLLLCCISSTRRMYLCRTNIVMDFIVRFCTYCNTLCTNQSNVFLYLLHICLNVYNNVNVNLNVSVYSLKSPLSSADFTIYAPGIGTLSYTVASPPGRIQHLCTLLQL